MNTRLELLVDGVKNMAACCCFWLRDYSVSYRSSNGEWTVKEIRAYSYKDAAKRLGLKEGLELRAGYNCFVSRVIRRRP